VLAAALVSFFVGGVARFDAGLLAASWLAPEGGLGFWPLFAIFFPAVTGFTQGVSLSGELRDPGRSLPLGTFLAVGLSTLVYFAVMVLLAAAVPGPALVAETDAVRRVAAQAWLVDAGVLSATLSSALASLLGAPRILQALARDGVFASLRFFARGHGAARNPRRAVLLSGAVALGTIGVGNLNSIAALVSMFFLISYGLLNYATCIEATGASPGFRPRFRFFHPRASGLGMLLCGGAMLAIDPAAGAIAIAILAAVYQYVRRTAVPARWRDSRRAYRLRRVREELRELAAREEQPGEWQPQILVFTESEERRPRVLQFAAWISGGAGMVTAVQVLEGETVSERARAACAEAEQALRAEIDAHQLDAYALAVAAPDVRVGLAGILQSWGMGPIRSNLVVVNWLGDGQRSSSSAALWYGRTLGEALRWKRSVVVLAAGEEAWQRMEERPNEERRIDVWWFGGESSRLSLLLAYLVTRHESWDEASLRVLVATGAGNEEHAAARVERRLEEVRIEAEVRSVADPDLEALAALCADAALVFLPLRLPGMRPEDPFGLGIDAILARLPMTALVAAAEDVPLAEEEEAQPHDSGPSPKEEAGEPASSRPESGIA
jgi:hypothetical protein